MTTATGPQSDSTTPDGNTAGPWRPPPAWVGFALSGLIALVFVAIGTWATYWADLRNDQFQLIHLGQTVYDGGRMYVDCWENKPPGIAWLNAVALALAAGNPLGAWILPGVVSLASIAVVAWGTARVLGRAAAIGLLFAAALTATSRKWWPDFLATQLAIAVLVQSLQRLGGLLNFRCRNFTVFVGVQRFH